MVDQSSSIAELDAQIVQQQQRLRELDVIDRQVERYDLTRRRLEARRYILGEIRRHQLEPGGWLDVALSPPGGVTIDRVRVGVEGIEIIGAAQSDEALDALRRILTEEGAQSLEVIEPATTEPSAGDFLIGVAFPSDTNEHPS